MPGSYAPSIVRAAQLLFKAIEKEGMQGGKGDNNGVVRHRQIPQPWNPTRACVEGGAPSPNRAVHRRMEPGRTPVPLVHEVGREDHG